MPSPAASRVATCEDYDSDNSEVLHDTRKQANVKARRSNPSDLGKDKTAASVASDSGYSSHTAATMSSADSQRNTKGSLHRPVAAVVDDTIRTASPSKTKRRPTLVQDARTTSQQQSFSSRAAQASAQAQADLRAKQSKRDSKVMVCNDPNCKSCPGSALDTGFDTNYPPFNSYSQRSPPSPSTTRRPTSTYGPPAQAVVQPAQTHRRSSSQTRPRPSSMYGHSLSYHGAEHHNAWPYGVQAPQPHGPPPATSAYYINMPAQPVQPYTAMGQTPPNASYFPLQQGHHPSLSYGSPGTGRPNMQHRYTADSTTYSTRRQSNSGLPTTISYGQPSMNPPASTLPQSRPSARYDDSRRFVSGFDSDTPSSSSSEDDEYDEPYADYTHQERRQRKDSKAMPPPTSKVVRSHSKRSENVRTSTRPQQREREVEYINGTPGYYERERARTMTAAPSSSRTASNRRPSIASSGRTKATSYSGNSSRSGGHVVVESKGRRISYMGHEGTRELEAKHREAKHRETHYKTYAVPEPPGAFPQYHEKSVPVSRDPRADKSGPSRRRESMLVYGGGGSEHKTVTTQARAEEYQQRNGTEERDFLTETLRDYNAAQESDRRTKRASRHLSDAKSTTSRSSNGGRTTMTKDTQAGIRITGLDGGQPVKLRIEGGADTSLEFRQNERGESEVVIGGVEAPRPPMFREHRYITGSERRSRAGSLRDDSVSTRGSRKSEKDRGRRRENIVHSA